MTVNKSVKSNTERPATDSSLKKRCVKQKPRVVMVAVVIVGAATDICHNRVNYHSFCQHRVDHSVLHHHQLLRVLAADHTIVDAAAACGQSVARSPTCAGCLCLLPATLSRDLPAQHCVTPDHNCNA